MNFTGSFIPLFKLLIPACLGIWCGDLTGTSFIPALTVFLLAIVLFTILPKKTYPRRHLSALPLYLMSFSVFMMICNWRHLQNSQLKDLPIVAGQYCVYQVLDNPSTKASKQRFTASMVAYHKDSTWTSSAVLVQCTVDSLDLTLKPGMRLLSTRPPKQLTGPRNPFEFDYRKYLYRRGILWQTYLGTDELVMLKPGKISLPRELTLHVLEGGKSTLEKTTLHEDDKALLFALLFGQKQGINDERYNAFSEVGIIHILAVSGLHVGLIYMVLGQLLFFLDRYKNGKPIKLILLILGLWTYALITGLGPSVCRASTMFSFILIGQLLYKQPNTYNNIAAAGLLLLIVDPWQLFNLGFQLSFLAVLGIVSFHRSISHWVSFNWKPLNKAWSLMAVSLSAQVFTLPLCLYTFNQFPTYFLLANLVAIPLITCILYGALMCLALFFFPAVQEAIVFVLQHLIALLNMCVDRIRHLPGHLLENIAFDGLDLAFMYTVMLLLIYTFRFKKSRILHRTLILVLLWQARSIMTHSKQDAQLVLMSVRKAHVISIENNGKTALYHSRVSSKTLDFHIGKYIIKQRHPSLHELDTTSDYILTPAAHIWIIHNQSTLPDSIPKEFDYVWIWDIPQNPGWTDCIQNQTVLMDAGTPFWKTPDIKKELKKAQIKFVDSSEGFESINLHSAERAN